MKIRNIVKLVSGKASIDGAGVRLVRVLGTPTIKDFDPFLMLDAFDSRNPDDYVRGFPTHPHRGIETFTFLVEGEIDHEDSLGNKGRILPGGAQWMTAGGGILHQEMPQASPRMLGLQLWVNLPAEHKMASPKYREITDENVPVAREDAADIRILSGEYKGRPGAAAGEYVAVRFLHVYLKPGMLWRLETPVDHTVFAYIMEGTLSADNGKSMMPARQAALFSEGEAIELSGGPEGANLVVVSGAPLHEPVAWGGPIVMNTDQELREAYQDLEDGTFIRD